MKRLVCSLMILLDLALLAACCEGFTGAAAEWTAVPTADAAEPTDTPAPSATPVPTLAPPVSVEVEAPKATPCPTAMPSDTPEPTDIPTPTPEPTPDCLHGAAHPDVFGTGDPLKTESSYVSDQVSIRIEKIENPEGFPKPMVCFVADIYIEDVTSIRSAWSRDTLRNSANDPMDVLDLMGRENALLMINGDYVSKWDFGCVVVNGEVARRVDNPRYDPCVLLRDGRMLTLDGNATSSDQIIAMDPWQAWCFGPALLDGNGHAKDTFNSSLTGANPRTALGYYAPGHYCFVVVDGRRNAYSRGMTLPQLSRFMESLGCQAAYNLDGGDSSVMAFDGRRVNAPRSRRSIPDVIYIAEPRKVQ